jgi:ATP-dependent DNA ligase
MSSLIRGSGINSLVKERRTRAFARQTIRASRAASPEASRAFDLIELDGEDFRLLPLCKRKTRLARLLARVPPGIELNEHTGAGGAEVFRQACKMGLEGIVSKRMTAAPYRSGPSRDWIKVKRQPSDAAGARGAMVMAADLEQLLAPADLIPAGPLVPARRLISAMDLRPIRHCRLVA